jgi:hypothetical protein
MSPETRSGHGLNPHNNHCKLFTCESEPRASFLLVNAIGRINTVWISMEGDNEQW